MLNFPVAGGTSGHLLGGALAAVLVGPWAGALCVAVVLLVQALLFADGGLTALGLNIVNMALVTALGGYAVFLAAAPVLPPATRASVAVAAGIAAGLSVVLASLAFVVEYAIGGTGGASVGTVSAAMVGVHIADRHRRGHHHRPHRRRRPGRPPRPGLRRRRPPGPLVLEPDAAPTTAREAS